MMYLLLETSISKSTSKKRAIDDYFQPSNNSSKSKIFKVDFESSNDEQGTFSIFFYTLYSYSIFNLQHFLGFAEKEESVKNKLLLLQENKTETGIYHFYQFQLLLLICPQIPVILCFSLIKVSEKNFLC